MRIRRAGADDIDFLQQMLLEAVNWDPGMPPLSADEVRRQPDLERILAGWGRAGDVALVMVDENGSRSGGCWYRFWNEREHSYGFVAEDVPELGVAILPEHRSRGLGSRLLAALLAEADRQGIARLSLSVARGNPARRLYARMGFKKHRRDGDAWTMIVETAGAGSVRGDCAGLPE